MYRRMGISPVQIRPLAARLTPAAQPGLVKTGYGPLDGPDKRLDFSEAPIWLRFLKPPGFEQLTTSPTFTPIRKGSQVFHTEAEMTALLDGAASWLKRLEAWDARTPEEIAVRAGELDVLSKLTSQNGWFKGAHIKHASPKEGVLPDLWLSILEKVARLVLIQDAPLDEPQPRPPLDTNAGFPTYQRGLSAQLLSAACTMGSIEESWRFAAGEASSWGLPSQCALAYGYNTRTGPTSKFLPDWDWSGGAGWSATDEVRSAWCRRRHVWMGSKPPLMLTRPLMRLLKASRRVARGLWHKGDSDDRVVNDMHALRLRGHIMVESDISAYDATVRRSLQEAVASVLKKKWPHVAAAVDAWLFAEGLPCIYPSYVTGGSLRSASLVTKVGETSSGQLLTAEIGTLINLVTCLYALTLACGINALSWWLDGKIELLVQGDDVLLAAPRFETEAFEAAYRDVGLTAKPLQGWRFLAKHRLPNGPRPVGARIIQQTFFHEHEPTGREAIPILALGFHARWGHGPPLECDVAKEVSALALRTSYAAQRQWREPEDILAWTESSIGRAEIQAALLKRASLPWLQQLQHDADHSPSAAAQMEALIRMGFVIDQSALQHGWRLMDIVASWTVSRKQRVLREAAKIMAQEPQGVPGVLARYLGELPEQQLRWVGVPGDKTETEEREHAFATDTEE